ncbi:MAG: 30S ribosomal protein S9 [Candidatus Omnitrophica bacterium]|nr:30S ribosomal protein S9 [Candidatus Omnitrophota bacterium]
MEAITKYKALGRRKQSVARVEMVVGSGSILINGRPYENYFLRKTDQIVIKQPLEVTNTLNKFDIISNITGGGLSGQAGALRLGIARGLMVVDPAYKEMLRKNGFLTRDPRAKERKKFGQKGARKRFQWTKR